MRPTRRWTDAAPWLGAIAGFALAVPLSRMVSMTAKPGQLPGIAASLGFDPRGYLWRLVVLVLCPILGGFLAAWITRAVRTGGEVDVLPPARLLRPATLAILLALAILSAGAGIRSRTPANLFEDGHGLLPASEYLRGELPYRDVVPGHGLISDGLWQTAGLKIFGDDYRAFHRLDIAVSAVFWPSLFVLAYAATGSLAAACGALALTFLSFPQPGFLRVVPSFWGLALAIQASRTGSRRLWLACGALIPLALLVAVEFAAYTAVASVVAIWVAKGSRRRHLLAFALGALASGSVIALGLAAKGILTGFVTTTFFYLPTLMPAYGIPLVRPALPWSPQFENVFAFLTDPTMFLYATVVLAVLVLAALLPRGADLGDRARAMLPILAWVVIAMISVVERRHVRYPMFLVPLALVLLLVWFRGERPWASARGVLAAAALVLIVILWKPVPLVRRVATDLSQPARPREPGTFPQPRRARGAVFPPPDAALVRATAGLIEKANLAPGETWFDFANAPGLHYLFDRDCPIRYYEVPFYESPAAQDEVVAALERNPRVKAVLVASGLPSDPIDGVPNAARAPRVAKFLELNFEPFLRQDGVEFWLRRPSSR